MSQVYFNRPSTVDSLIFDGNTGSATPAGSIINIVGTGSVTTSAAGNTVTISVNDAGILWQTVTNSVPTNPISMEASNGYIPTGGVAVDFLLPVTAAIGDTFYIEGDATDWVLGQNNGQTITMGTSSIAIGAGHGVQSTLGSDGVVILCVATNVRFKILDWAGNLLVF